MSMSTILEFNCFRMQPEDTYCQSELTSFQEIPSTRLGSFAIAYNQDVLVCGGVNVNRQGQDSCDLLKNIKQWKFGFKQMDQPRSFAAALHNLGRNDRCFVAATPPTGTTRATTRARAPRTTRE